MSWRIANECTKRKFGSPVRKQIIMFLADKASDDGSGVWCSVGTIYRQTELGESTVKRTIKEFRNEGILIKTGRRKCKNGFTNVYRIDLGQIAQLESTAGTAFEAVPIGDPVQHEPSTGATVDGVLGPQRTPNLPSTIQEPPTREREGAGEVDSEKVLEAYPKDRIRGKATCIEIIEASLKDGFMAKDLLEAVNSYASESAGFSREKVCWSDNWFRSGRWRERIEDLCAKREQSQVAIADHLEQVACWIIDRNPMCKHITSLQVEMLLAAKLVTEAQVQAAGLHS